MRPQFAEQGQVVQILKCIFFNEQAMDGYGLPDISSGPFNWWPHMSYVYNRESKNVRDLQICRDVRYVPKMAIR